MYLSILSCMLFVIIKVVSASNFQTYATIIRHFENEGFHREVHSLVELVTAGQSAFWSNCTLILVETIPSGLYVNTDQLSDLHRLGLVHACTKDTVDIEASEHASKEHTVFVYSKLHRTENLVYADIKLPIHVRYHQPSVGGGYIKVDLKSPLLLVQCEEDLGFDIGKKVQAPCPYCRKEMCSWLNVSYKTNSPIISLSVPVGNLNHLAIVTLSTYLLTIGGCLYVLSAVVNKFLTLE